MKQQYGPSRWIALLDIGNSDSGREVNPARDPIRDHVVMLGRIALTHTVPVNRCLVVLVGALPVLLMACAPDGEPTSLSTSSPPAVTTTPTATPTPVPRTFTLVATGDVLLHERLWRQAKQDAAQTGNGTLDFTPQLANIAPIVSAADLAICHLEVPLAPPNGPYSGYPTFSGPPQVVSALDTTGYDACSTASNHTFDQGAPGVTRTLDTLDAAGIVHAGSARSPAEAKDSTIVDVETNQGPIRVGLLSYSYGFNGIPYPDGETFWANQIAEQKILAAAATARRRGAEVVVVALHWGTEYDHDPNAQQSELAPRLIGSPDIDLLLGHHAHVVQPIENLNGEWVVYGMGNLMANHAEPEGPKSEGLLTRFTFAEDMSTGGFAVTAAEYLPLYQTYELPVEVLVVPEALASGETGTTTTARLEQARTRTTDIVTSRGDSTGLALLSP
jgi:poly-gamma-glutamate capsule biosynthesis protein CapA/YwtB (metallophosphatase superfamily)